MDFLTPFLKTQNCIILDGGLATELEQLGADLNDPLWSAKVLLEDQDLIRKVHRTYLKAGADIICSASYQATIQGFMSKGLNRAEAKDLIKDSVTIACETRDEFWRNNRGILKPLVAASIGPYGAFLADGSEYTGDYPLNTKEFIDFHKDRFDILAQTNADLFAFETIPKLEEAKALISLLGNYSGKCAWLSFSCRNETELVSGERIADVLKIANNSSQILAVGVNCTAPENVKAILHRMSEHTNKYLIAYPNKGEEWDPIKKSWKEQKQIHTTSEMVRDWYKTGARVIGGCCRTRPEDIAFLRQILNSSAT